MERPIGTVRWKSGSASESLAGTVRWESDVRRKPHGNGRVQAVPRPLETRRNGNAGTAGGGRNRDGDGRKRRSGCGAIGSDDGMPPIRNAGNGVKERAVNVKMDRHLQIEEMSDRELRICRRTLRLRRERRHKARRRMVVSAVATLCAIVICAMCCSAIKTNANNGYKYYTDVVVEAGDSLWTLAEEYVDLDYYKDVNSYVREVRHINHLTEETAVMTGQVLIVPYYSAEYVY